MPNMNPKPEVEVDFEACSNQVQVLCEDFDYHQRVKGLWADTADDPGPRLLKQRGYGYLVTLYYGIQARTKAEGKPMSDEFLDLAVLCRYVGPRPTAAHSLHRLDNYVGYRIGNLEWADKRKQSEFRRNSQHHLYMGRRLTDRQIVEHLTAKGTHVSESAVKKYRQRSMKKGITGADMTRSLFKKHNISYETGGDPVEAWDFPDHFSQLLTPVYQNLRHPHESRIAFYIRWLRREFERDENLAANPLTTPDRKLKLLGRSAVYRSEILRAKIELEKLHNRKVDAALQVFIPPSPPQCKPAIPKAQMAWSKGTTVAPLAVREPSQVYKPTAEALLVTFAMVNSELRATIMKTAPKCSYWYTPPISCRVLNVTLDQIAEWKIACRDARSSRVGERPFYLDQAFKEALSEHAQHTIAQSV